MSCAPTRRRCVTYWSEASKKPNVIAKIASCHLTTSIWSLHTTTCDTLDMQLQCTRRSEPSIRLADSLRLHSESSNRTTGRPQIHTKSTHQHIVRHTNYVLMLFMTQTYRLYIIYNIGIMATFYQLFIQEQNIGKTPVFLYRN